MLSNIYSQFTNDTVFLTTKSCRHIKITCRQYYTKLKTAEIFLFFLFFFWKNQISNIASLRNLRNTEYYLLYSPYLTESKCLMTLNPNPLKAKTALINKEYRKISDADDDAV